MASYYHKKSLPIKNRPMRTNYTQEDFPSEVTIRRCGAEFIIPPACINKNGSYKKGIKELITNATKENIMKLERLGIRCNLQEIAFVG